MTKQTRKYLLNILLLLAVTALALFFVLKDNTEEIIAALAKSNVWYILLGLALVFLCYIIEGVILTVFARLYKRDYKLHKGVFNAFIGSFFSGITPSSSGGQFVQAYTFSKQGVRVTNGASILFMHFIVHQTILVLYGLVALIFKFNDMRQLTMVINIFGFNFDIISLSLVGFAINTLVIVGLFFLAFSKKLHSLIVNGGINLLAKMKIVKNPEQKRIDINTKVATFRIELKRLTQNWGVLITVALLMVVKMTIMYSIPYLMGLALSVDIPYTLFDGVALTSFVSMVTAMIPIPGASGGAEFVFASMFRNFFDGTLPTVNAINLLWRAETFYFGLILGGLVFIFYRESPKAEAVRIDSRTMLDLEVINLQLHNEKEQQKQTLKKPDIYIPKEETAEEIEERFRLLKEDLKKQLDANEKATEDESNKED